MWVVTCIGLVRVLSYGPFASFEEAKERELECIAQTTFSVETVAMSEVKELA